MIRHPLVILSLVVVALLASAEALAVESCEAVFHVKRSKILEISMQDLDKSRSFLDTIDRSRTVGIYGSARLAKEHPAYKEAFRFAQLLGLAKKISVTGGGRSIMEAGNAGSRSVGGETYGVVIKLPHEVTKNPFLDAEISHQELYTRMEVLVRTAGAGHAFFYGGIGTLQEVSHVLSLIQNRQMAKSPVVLVGTEYWKPLVGFLENSMLKEGTISKEDMELFKVVDTAEQAFAIIFPNEPIPVIP